MKTLNIPIPSGGAVRRALLGSAAFVLLAYVAYTVREIWLPLGLAFLVAMVLDPVVDRMERRGWSRTWASVFIFGSFLLIVGGLNWGLVGLFNGDHLVHVKHRNDVPDLEEGFGKSVLFGILSLFK